MPQVHTSRCTHWFEYWTNNVSVSAELVALQRKTLSVLVKTVDLFVALVPDAMGVMFNAKAAKTQQSFCC